jgi:isocitrate dehydrogenase kinase/phosphatase
VQECVHALEDEYAPEDFNDGTWRETKLHYIGLLTGHKRPELAESFFNSVSCHILHRSYYRNDFIFVRPAVSTDYIETEEPQPTYRVYYPQADGLRGWPCAASSPTSSWRARSPTSIATSSWSSSAWPTIRLDKAEPNQQLQVLSSLFFRNKGAYIVGRAINGAREVPVHHAGPARPRRRSWCSTPC